MTEEEKATILQLVRQYGRDYDKLQVGERQGGQLGVLLLASGV